jgi:dolichol-phosphate mannosyltransferase
MVGLGDRDMFPRSITIVVPCYNEEESLKAFYDRVSALAQKLQSTLFEFLFVNDGSQDGTAGILDLLADRDSRVKVLHLAKNRGHQIAVTAGMDFAGGDMIVIMDADLQDPPELIEEMAKAIGQGADLVHAKRRRRDGETWFKRLSARIFYRMMRRMAGVELVEDCGDFRAFTRPVLEAARYFREPHRFLRGLFASLGFRQQVLFYDRDRRFAGSTKYPLCKMLRLATDALFSFSTAPIRIITALAFGLWGVSLIYLGKAFYDRFILEITVPGWTSIILLLTAYTGLLLFCLGILGAYISRIFEQGQARPLYWLSSMKNMDVERLLTRTPSFVETRLSLSALPPPGQGETGTEGRMGARSGLPEAQGAFSPSLPAGGPR